MTVKGFALVLFLSVTCSSCYIFRYEEAKQVLFDLDNIGQSYYSKIIIYAKDSSNSVIDSTSSHGYTPNEPINSVAEPNSRGVVVGFTLLQFKDVKKGFFEINTKILNGKLLSKEFGSIDGLNTRQEFKIDLKDSMIIIK